MIVFFAVQHGAFYSAKRILCEPFPCIFGAYGNIPQEYIHSANTFGSKKGKRQAAVSSSSVATDNRSQNSSRGTLKAQSTGSAASAAASASASGRDSTVSSITNTNTNVDSRYTSESSSVDSKDQDIDDGYVAPRDYMSGDDSQGQLQGQGRSAASSPSTFSGAFGRLEVAATQSSSHIKANRQNAIYDATYAYSLAHMDEEELALEYLSERSGNASVPGEAATVANTSVKSGLWASAGTGTGTERSQNIPLAASQDEDRDRDQEMFATVSVSPLQTRMTTAAAPFNSTGGVSSATYWGSGSGRNN
jgi:hypothetical protein